MFDPVVFGLEGDVDEQRRTVEVTFGRVTGVDWGWVVPNVRLMPGPVGVPVTVDEAVRAAVSGVVRMRTSTARHSA
jgi:hypothetical protein